MSGRARRRAAGSARGVPTTEPHLTEVVARFTAVRARSDRTLARVAVVAAASGGVLAALAVGLDPNSAELGTTALAAFVVSGVTGLTRRHQRRRYPHLGLLADVWRRAGVTPSQLAVLNEAHRLRRLTPPVGYRDRATVINPLADAYAILTSPAWGDPWLADRKLLIDPVLEAAEVIDHVHRVTTVLAEVRGRAWTVPARSPAVQIYADYERALLDALDDGLRRARALTAYRVEVARLAEALAGSRAVPEADALADRVLDVVSESARHELARQHLDDRRAELQLVEEGLREITQLLDGSPELPSAPRTEGPLTSGP